MKSKSIGSLILLAILAPSCGSNGSSKPRPRALPPRWTTQFRSPTSVDLRVVLIANSKIAVAAGQAGTFIRTDDSGATWRNLETSPASRSGDIVAFSVGGRSVVAVGSDSGGGGREWHSEDTQQFFTEDAGGTPGAYTDAQIVIGSTSPYTSDHYRLRMDGNVEHWRGTLLSTVDSAQPGVVPPGTASSWTRADNLVFFSVSGIGFVCGDKTGAGQIRITTDGLQSWQSATLPAACPPLRKFSVLSTTAGYAVGDNGTVVLITNDPGPTPVPLGFYWAHVPNHPGGLTQNLHGVHFPVDVNTGWVVGDGGTIWKIFFNGAAWTWTKQNTPIPTTEDLYDVNFMDNNNGYIVGNNGTVLKTSNGGATWADLGNPLLPGPPSRTQGFNAVDFDASGTSGLAVGNGGMVLRTLDGGGTWTVFNSGAGASDLLGVSIPKSGSGTHAYLCGRGGTVRTNADWQGAGTWTTPTGITGGIDYETILFPTTDAIGVVAGGGTILRTTDSGSSYLAPATPPAAGVYHALARTPDGLGMVLVGDAALVASSGDLGNVWSSVAGAGIPGGTNLFAAAAPNGSMFAIYAGGSDGKVYRYKLGAPNVWEATTPPGGTTVVGLAFASELTGIALTQGTTGGVFTTSFGGVPWERSVVHVKVDGTHHLRGVVLNSASVGTVVGDNGVILNTSTAGQ